MCWVIKTPYEQIELAKKYKADYENRQECDTMGKNYKETLNELLKNPEFKAEYEALEPEFQIIRAMLEGREKLNLTQKDLAERSGITQADISRLENGNANPSIRTLKKLASAMNMALDIKFVPLVKA